MKSRPSFLRRLLRKILRRPAPAAPKRPAAAARVRTGIEPLEGRVAPAALVSASSFTFNDLDGDIVTVTFSKALFDPTKTVAENHLNEVFKFSDGTAAVNFESTGAQQLQLIDLTRLPTTIVNGAPVNPAAGTDITVAAVKGAGNVGDDLTNVGAIKATGFGIGAVNIDGDLGQIDAGSAASKVGVASLSLASLGKFGATTQLSTTTAADALESKVTGKIKSVTIAGDCSGYLHVTDGTSIVNNNIVTSAPAKIGVVTINGSLRGGTANNSGTIESAGTIGTVSILGTSATDPAGLIGGAGSNSGSLIAGKSILSATVSAALNGGAGANSGAILAKAGDLGSLTIGGGLKGAGGSGSGSVLVTGALPLATITGGMTGGVGANSGSVQITGVVGAATINGGLTGGDGDGSGVLSSTGTMTTVVINGDLTGVGPHSGGISAGDLLTSVVVNGKITGGNGVLSGFIEGLKDIGTVKITGDVTGGLGQDSATIVAGHNVARIVIAGKLKGGQGINSGSIFNSIDPFDPGILTLAKVKGGIEGGDGFSSGSIIAGGTVGTVVAGTGLVPAKLQGGVGDFSGVVYSSGTIGSVKVLGFVQGGAGKNSGSIQSTGLLTSVNISGALTGGDGDFSGTIISHDEITESGDDIAGDLGTILIGGDIAGGIGVKSGRIQADGDLAALTALALKGGAGTNSGSIQTGRGTVHPGDAPALTFSGAITSTVGSVDPTVKIGGRIGTLTVGAGLTDASIRAGDDLSIATITGDVTGSTITARGQNAQSTIDLAIASIMVTGSVTDSHILAGYDLSGAPVNADASIGSVKVTGNWTASDLVAGVADTLADGFGNADDVKISGGTDIASRLSQITSVVVKGTVEGSAAAGDHFGFTAQKILAFKVGATSLALDPLIAEQTFELGTFTDVTVREVPV